MKLNRLLIASLLGFSLLTTSALACDKGSSSHESHWSLFGWCHHDDSADSDSHKRECDQNGQNSGIGNNCDHGKGNGGGYCGTSGSSSSGSGSSSSGSGSSSGSLPGKGIS
jgi:hypothetical protein